MTDESKKKKKERDKDEREFINGEKGDVGNFPQSLSLEPTQMVHAFGAVTNKFSDNRTG